MTTECMKRFAQIEELILVVVCAAVMRLIFLYAWGSSSLLRVLLLLLLRFAIVVQFDSSLQCKYPNCGKWERTSEVE